MEKLIKQKIKMKQATIISALTLGTILIPISKPANANPYQDAQKVVMICNQYARNYFQYQACLNEGARIIQGKYSSYKVAQPQPVRKQRVRQQNRSRQKVDIITPGYLLGTSY